MKVWMLIATIGLVALAAACGDPAATGPGGAGAGDPDPGGEDLAIAPGCEDLEPIGGEAADHEPAATPGDQRLDLAEDITTWVAREAPDDFGGMWMDPPGSGRFTVAFTRDLEGYRAALHEHVGEDDRDRVRLVEVTHSKAELEAVQGEIGSAMGASASDREHDRFRPPPGTIVMSGIRTDLNRISLGVVGGDDAALAEVTTRYGADRVCLDVLELPQPMDPEGPVRPLAKVDGWRDGFHTDEFGLVEIAYDAETAERAWRENVPEALPERDGDPVEEGLYGSLDGVDFDRQAVVVWSGGQSGSCPGWLADIDVRDGEVVVERGAAGVGVCTDDYNPYRMVLAVERDRLPEPGDLPQDARAGPNVSALVTGYP